MPADPLQLLQDSNPGITFLAVADFKGYYVGTDGSLWSFKKRGPGGFVGEVAKRIKPVYDKDGYVKTILCDNGRRRHVRLQHLILETFVGPCPADMEARHLNNKRNDNQVSNLVWSTHLDNIRDKYRHGTIQRGAKSAVATINEVIASKIKVMIRKGKSTKEISETLQVSKSIISSIKSGGSWSYVK